MLLRRITQHVRSQNWFAVGIDFFIVVVGVFIGIQVANWNEARGDRATEAQYLSDLRSNLIDDQAEYESGLKTIAFRVGALNFVLMQALGEAPPSGIQVPVGKLSNLVSNEVPLPEATDPGEEDYSSLWATMNFVRTVTSKRGTYDALVGSGDIGLISNQELAGELHSYYRLTNGVSDVQGKFFSFGDDSLIGAGRRVGLSPFESVELDHLVKLVSENAEFAVYLRQERQKAALQYGLIGGLNSRAETLLLMLQ